jgi:hypothetical protein
MKSVAKHTAIGGAIGGVAAVGTGVGLSAVGFSSTGVVAGSIAAGIQSSIGLVSAGSAFATVQSVGAVGMLFCPPVVIGAVGVGAATGIAIAIRKNYINSKNDIKPKL